MDAMKVLVLTGYDDNFAEIGDKCTPTHRAYAARHGYQFERVRKYRTDTHPSWQKLRMLQERIDAYDAIIWLDADSVITNPLIDVIGLAGPTILTASQDWCAQPSEPFAQAKGINFGNFILRNTPDTQRWLAMAAKHTQYATRSTCCWEQDAVLKCMREDAWFNSQVTRLHRRALNSVHPSCEIPGMKAPDPWKPGDFLIHLTNVEDRPGKAEQYSIEGIKALTKWVPGWHETGNCADLRHIRWIYDLLALMKPQRTLEIGVYSGCSSSAFVQAEVPQDNYCDISIRQDFRNVVGPDANVHQRKGCDVLLTEHPFDVVFVDGAHDMQSVSEELEALLAKPPKVIIAHDVNSTNVGFPHCEGAAYLADELVRHGWTTVTDAQPRAWERTDRGMMMATKDLALLEMILTSNAANCW